MSTRFKDIPGYIVLSAIALLALVVFGVVKLVTTDFSSKSDFEKVFGYKTPEDMIAAQRAFDEEVKRQMLLLGPIGEVVQKAEGGDAEAQYNLGNIYLYGKDSQLPDYFQAWGWFNKSAGQNYAPAQYQIGHMIANGFFSGTNNEAAEWYLKAAEGGDQWAQRHVGEIYLHLWGEQFGLKRDIEAAYFWLSLGTEGYDPYSDFVEHRKAAESYLSEEQVQKLKKRIDEWKASHPVDTKKYR
jgi:TPR repeat protein